MTNFAAWRRALTKFEISEKRKEKKSKYKPKVEGRLMARGRNGGFVIDVEAITGI